MKRLGRSGFNYRFTAPPIGLSNRAGHTGNHAHHRIWSIYQTITVSGAALDRLELPAKASRRVATVRAGDRGTRACLRRSHRKAGKAFTPCDGCAHILQQQKEERKTGFVQM